MRQVRNLTLAFVTSLSLAACATIENPEDCDIRCGFGKNAEFEAENEVMRADLDQREADNAAIAEQLDNARVTAASLEQREANLRDLLNVQSNRLSQLESNLNRAVARNQMTVAKRNEIQAKIAGLDAEIKAYQAKPKMTSSDLDGVQSLVQGKLVPFLVSADVVNVVNIRDNMG